MWKICLLLAKRCSIYNKSNGHSKNGKRNRKNFYKCFCKKTQSKNGMWEQRFYTDGKLAPCWGYQVDETASVVFGVYEHYQYTKLRKNF